MILKDCRFQYCDVPAPLTDLIKKLVGDLPLEVITRHNPLRAVPHFTVTAVPFRGRNYVSAVEFRPSLEPNVVCYDNGNGVSPLYYNLSFGGSPLHLLITPKAEAKHPVCKPGTPDLLLRFYLTEGTMTAFKY